MQVAEMEAALCLMNPIQRGKLADALEAAPFGRDRAAAIAINLHV